MSSTTRRNPAETASSKSASGHGQAFPDGTFLRRSKISNRSPSFSLRFIIPGTPRTTDALPDSDSEG